MLAGQGSGRDGRRLFWPGWVPAGASAFWDFAGNRAWVDMEPVGLEDAISFERDGTALWNGVGDWEEYAAHALRRADGVGALLEPAFTELGNYATMAGAALGVIGSGGALPTGWNISSTTGMTVEVTAIGVTDGLPSIDVHFAGTPAANWRIRPTAAQALVTTPAQSHVASVFMALVNGSLPQADDARFGMLWYNSGTGFISASYQDVAPALTGDLTRQVVTAPSPDNADRANLDLIFSVTQSEVIDFELRFAVPNMGLGAAASTPVLSNGALATRAGDELTLPLPAGTHDLTMTFDDGSTAPLASGVSGSLLVDPALATKVLKHITARPA